MLVWQDMPALAINDPYTGNFGYLSKLAGEKAQHEAEMKRMIEVGGRTCILMTLPGGGCTACHMRRLASWHHAASVASHVAAECRSACMPQEHLSFPSIIQYETFNEGWGQYDTQRVVRQAKRWDPSRLFDAASGWVDPQDATDNAGGYYQHYPGYVTTCTCCLALLVHICVIFSWGSVVG